MNKPKLWTDFEFEQTQKFSNGFQRSFRSLRENKEPYLKNTNKPKHKKNLEFEKKSKVSDCAPFASLIPQKQQIKFKK